MPSFDRSISSQTTSVADSSPALYDGTQAAGATAAALNSGTSLPCVEIVVQNDPASPAAIVVGNASSQHMSLAIGASETLPIDNVNKIYVKRVGGADCTVNWHARG